MDDNLLLEEPRRKPWATTFFGLLAAGGLIAMPFLKDLPAGEQMPDAVRFIGHFHPVLLHLPIGVFILILLQELGAVFGRRHHEELANPSLFPLFFGAASAVVAVITGFLLVRSGDEYAGSALAERHLWGGLAFAVAAVLTFILKAWTVALAGNSAFYRSLLFASVGIMAFASHDGASLTHGADYLTKYAPDPIRGVLGLKKRQEKPETAAPSQSQVVYADIVAPIFERHCVECHKDGKAKGRLRMDTYELLVKGGKEGPGIEAGSSEKSNIVVRSILPEDDDDRMPPEGKPGFDAAELAVVKWWIDSGADPAKKLADFEIPAAIKEALNKLPAAKAVSGTKSGDATPHTGTASTDDRLKETVAGYTREFPGALAFESEGSKLLTFTAVSVRDTLDDAAFRKLEPVFPNLVTADLTATKITDRTVAGLAAAKALKHLRLSDTGVTDVAIDTLVKLPALETLNLYGTKVTDAGIAKISAMPHLKRLYLWKTAVTPDAIKALKEKLPGCEIVTGGEA